MSSSTLQLRQAIVSGIAGLGLFKTVVSHRGRVTLEEIKRHVVNAPSAMVVVSGGRSSGGNNTKIVNRKISVFIVTKNGVTPSDEQAIELSDRVISMVLDNRWGIDNAQLPEAVSDDNLYSGPLDAVGIALWAVSWTQKLELELDELPDYDAFETYVGQWVAPASTTTLMESIAEMEQPT